MIEDFLSYLELNRNRSRATVAAYRPLLRRLEEFLSSRGKGISSATVEDLELFSGPHLHQEGYDAGTRSKAISAVRGLYRWAERRGVISTNPAMALDHPKRPQALPEVWSLEDAEKMIWAPDLSTMMGVRDAAILAMLIGTGCRVSGITGLNESDIFTDLVDGERWVFVKLREKGKKERRVPLPKLTVVPLLMWLGHEERLALDETRHHLRTGDTRVVFCGMRSGSVPLHEWYGENRRMVRQSVWRMVLKYGRQVGIPEKLLHPHAARHLLGTHLFDEGVDQELRKAVMGHENDATLSIYTRMSRRRLLQVAGERNPLAAIRTPFDELSEVIQKPAPSSLRKDARRKGHRGS